MSKNYKKVNSINLSKGCTLTTNCITLQDGQTAKIIVENGKTKIMIENKEVKEEEPKFKKGDVLSCHVGKKTWIVIFKEIDKIGELNNMRYYCMLSCLGNLRLNSQCREFHWKYATEKEKRTLFVAMLNKGLFWDENKMKVRTLKDGDIITTKDNEGYVWHSIFKEIKDEKVYSYASLCKSSNICFGGENPLCYIRDISSIGFSTTEERQTLFDKIENEEHKKWNTETKKFEDIKWEPKKGEKYWYLTENFHVAWHTEDNDSTDKALGEVNNKFETEELAEAARDKIKELLSKL